MTEQACIALLINMHATSRVLKVTGYRTYHQPVTVYMCACIIAIWQLREPGASGKARSIVRRDFLNFYAVLSCLTSQLAMKQSSSVDICRTIVVIVERSSRRRWQMIVVAVAC